MLTADPLSIVPQGAALPHAAAPSAAIPQVPAGCLWSAADLRDPYRTFAQLADAGPLHWSPHLFGGTWVVARHADAEQVLRNDTLFSAQRTGGWVLADTIDPLQAPAPSASVSADGADLSGEEGIDAAIEASTDALIDEHIDALTGVPTDSPAALMPFQQILARALLFVDAPDHGRLRSLMHAGFTPSGLAAQRPWMQNRCNQLLDAMQAQQAACPDTPVDFMAHFARPLPAAVIAHTLGLPSGDEEEVMAWSSDIAGFIGSPWPNHSTTRAAQRGLLRMSRYLQAMLATPQRLAPEGLLARLLQGQAQGQVHNATELLAQAAMLLFAGHETTRYLLGNMLHTLLTQPMRAEGSGEEGDGVGEGRRGITNTMTAWQYLAQLPPDAQAQHLPHAVREVLRFEPPVQYTGRRVARTHTWHGQTLKRGQGMLVLLAAAGRDALRFDQPHTFNLHRRGRASLAFGTGAHVCIGAALSMMEAEITLAAMLTRWPQLGQQHSPCGLGGADHRARAPEPPQNQLPQPDCQPDCQPDWLGSALYRGLHSLPLWLPASVRA